MALLHGEVELMPRGHPPRRLRGPHLLDTDPTHNRWSSATPPAYPQARSRRTTPAEGVPPVTGTDGFIELTTLSQPRAGLPLIP
jgi:hypothetical protein